MQFYYLDPAGAVHLLDLSKPVSKPIVDIDIHWLKWGHVSFPKRLNQMKCFEKMLHYIPDDHQFTLRQWYDMRTQETHCMWYGIPKSIIALLPHTNIIAQTLAFTLQMFFPPMFRNKSVLVFVDVPGCEMVAGYVQGHCVCLKKLALATAIDVQHEWKHSQQAYPQWTFENSLYLSAQPDAQNSLIQTHHETICVDACHDLIKNRVLLYGLH